MAVTQSEKENHERDRRFLWIQAYTKSLGNPNRAHNMAKDVADRAVKDFDETFKGPIDRDKL